MTGLRHNISVILLALAIASVSITYTIDIIIKLANIVLPYDIKLVSSPVVNDPFVIINADDFYGRDAYLKAAEFIKTKDKALYNMKALVSETIF